MIDWDSMLHGDDDRPPVQPETGKDATPAFEAATPAAGLPGIGSRERDRDNRRCCAECGGLASKGRCMAAARRDIIASRGYAPAPDLLRRCEGFKPLPNDPDQRPGRDRWPGL